jgi:putative peptidoglycan lipid II flippase
VARALRPGWAAASRLGTPPGAAASPEAAGIAADSGTAALWTLASRVTGFGRMAVVAAVLGPTFFGNLFQTLNVLPNTLHDLLVGSLVTALLVPPLVRSIDLADRDGVARLANGFLGVMLLVFAAVVVLCVVGAPVLLALLTLAVDDPAVRAEQQRLGWPLLLLVMPQLLLYGIAATGAAVQHAHRRFALPAGAPALENLGVIAVMAASAVIFGVGMDVAEVTFAHILFLGLGSTAAVALHAAAQWWGAFRLGVVLWPRAGWRDAEVRQIVRLAIPSGGNTVLHNLTFLGLLVVAGSVPGGAVAFLIGLSFLQLPVALWARPLANAQLPRLSRSVADGNPQGFAATYRDSQALALFAALPTSLLFLAVAGTLAGAVSFGEMAGPAGIALVTAAIAAMAPAIFGESVLQVATSASYARRDAVLPLRAMALRCGLTALGMGLALLATDGEGVLWTLGLSYSAATLIAGLYLHVRVAGGLAGLGLEARRRLGDLAAAAAAAAVAMVLAGHLGGEAAGSAGRIIAALLVMAAAALSYLAIQALRGSSELRSLRAGLRQLGASDAGGERP